jgi:class 3 adenylate cyclase
LGIGVATGGAIVGRLAEGANVSVLGDATNLASRLQAAARAGEILISDETWRHLAARPEAKVERLRLKGFQRAVKAYRLKSPGT